MTSIELEAYVTEDGEVKFKLPAGVSSNQFRIKAELVTADELNGSQEDEWTDEELDQALRFNPVPAKDIITGGWEDMSITDSQAWVDELRRKEQEQRGWQMYS